MIHRDLKPANLFLSVRPDGTRCLKVLDFGVSKYAHDVALATQRGALLGTPLYMSPEQFESSDSVDARADIWALGVILYEFVTGCTPFPSMSLMQLAVAIATKEPTAPSVLGVTLPTGLERAILRCMEKQPEARFATVEALLRAIRPFAA